MTFPPKVIGLVTSCGECPYYAYDSGGACRCQRVGEVVRNKHVVAPFCPLPDHPSRVVAEMQMTILGLRGQEEHGFGMVFLTHIATKLGLNLSADGSGISIPFKDKGKDCVSHLLLRCICEVRVHPLEITFVNGESRFKLTPESDPPLLHVAADKEGQEWKRHPISRV